MPVKINGVAALKARLQELAQRVPDRVEQALSEAGDALLEDAKARVPVSTGELHDSGYVSARPGRVTVGFSSEHALTVHERLDVQHEQGEAKFLERAALSKEQQIRSTLAAVVEDALK